MNNHSSTTSEIRNGHIYFKSSNTSWKTPLLAQVGTVARKTPSGELTYHELFELEDWEKKEWPWATHRMSLTPRFEQSNPLFSSCPVGIKENCKYQLLLGYKNATRHADDQWKIISYTIHDQKAVA